MLTLNLKPIFIARGIERPFRFLVKNGIPRDTAHYMIINPRPYIKLEYIERLCEILHCEPNDLFQWHPKSDTQHKEEHPLFSLYQPAAQSTNFKTMLSKVPYKQLVNLSEMLSKEIEEKEILNKNGGQQ